MLLVNEHSHQYGRRLYSPSHQHVHGQPGQPNAREVSTPQQAELPVVSAATARGSLTGSDADKISFLRTRLEDTERRLKAMEAEATIAKSKLKQSMAREEFYVQEMGKASKELLCKYPTQPLSICK